MINTVWNILLELSPWLLLGAVVAGALHAFVPADWFRRRLSGEGGILTAVLIGIPLPLCSCSVIPVGLGLRRDGASAGAATGFLISTPQTGVDSILVSSSFLGWPFALFKVAAALVMGLVGGLLANLVRQPGADSPADVSDAASLPVATTSQPAGLRLTAALWHGTELIRSIWRWLVAGILISALLTWAVPPDLLTRVPGMTGITALLATLALSIPLYVCATASVPIAAALYSSGLPAGAVMVFLMAGPATNVATLGAVYRSLGGRTLAVYMGTMIVGSLAAGLLFDSWLVVGPSAAAMHHHHQFNWISMICAVILLGMLAWFCFEDGSRWWRRRNPQPATVTLDVTGMTCENCAAGLERSFKALENVQDAQVSFATREARIFGDPSLKRLLEVVADRGFAASEKTPES